MRLPPLTPVVTFTKGSVSPRGAMVPTKTIERIEYDKAKAVARLAHTLAYRRADETYRMAMTEALRAFQQMRAEKRRVCGGRTKSREERA